jgi:hypothetical protein
MYHKRTRTLGGGGSVKSSARSSSKGQNLTLTCFRSMRMMFKNLDQPCFVLHSPPEDVALIVLVIFFP